MKKVLMVGSMGSMIANFNIENLKILKKLNYEIHVAANLGDKDPISNDKRKYLLKFFEDNNIKYYNIAFPRGTGSIRHNLKIIRELDLLLKKNNFAFVHTNSPLASVLVRLVCIKRKTKVIYTAHGFQFYKGAHLKDWLLYYSVERFLAKWTSTVITINKEDFYRAKKMKFKKVEYIPGVGIDIKKIDNQSDTLSNIKDINGTEINLMNKSVLISVGELNNNKNHISVMKALNNLKTKEDIIYLICGIGENLDIYKKFIEENNLKNTVFLLGYCTEIIPILKLADLFVFPSFREGLSVAVMEAMTCGLPILASDIRGNNDLVDDHKGGRLFRVDNNELINILDGYIKDKHLWKEHGRYNRKKIVENYTISIVNEKMNSIYCNIDKI